MAAFCRSGSARTFDPAIRRASRPAGATLPARGHPDPERRSPTDGAVAASRPPTRGCRADGCGGPRHSPNESSRRDPRCTPLASLQRPSAGRARAGDGARCRGSWRGSFRSPPRTNGSRGGICRRLGRQRCDLFRPVGRSDPGIVETLRERATPLASRCPPSRRASRTGPCPRCSDLHRRRAAGSFSRGPSPARGVVRGSHPSWGALMRVQRAGDAASSAACGRRRGDASARRLYGRSYPRMPPARSSLLAPHS